MVLIHTYVRVVHMPNMVNLKVGGLLVDLVQVLGNSYLAGTDFVTEWTYHACFRLSVSFF